MRTCYLLVEGRLLYIYVHQLRKHVTCLSKGAISIDVYNKLREHVTCLSKDAPPVDMSTLTKITYFLLDEVTISIHLSQLRKK